LRIAGLNKYPDLWAPVPIAKAIEIGAAVSKGVEALSRLYRASTIGAIIVAALVTASASFTIPCHAQFHPIAAPGFEINLFADPTNVPDFVNCPSQNQCYTGPLSMAFDSRGRLFVGTGAGTVLILLDNDGDGKADQVKTFATGLPQPFGLEFRNDGDLFVTSNLVLGVGRVIRLHDLNGDDIADASERTTIIDNLPSEGDHQTTRLKFGPDGFLYVGQGSTTDAGTGGLGERLYNASILRVDVDSPSVSVFATGLRNPFGIGFDPISHQLFATDIGSGCDIGLGCPPTIRRHATGLAGLFEAASSGFRAARAFRIPIIRRAPECAARFNSSLSTVRRPPSPFIRVRRRLNPKIKCSSL